MFFKYPDFFSGSFSPSDATAITACRFSLYSIPLISTFLPEGNVPLNSVYRVRVNVLWCLLPPKWNGYG